MIFQKFWALKFLFGALLYLVEVLRYLVLHIEKSMPYCNKTKNIKNVILLILFKKLADLMGMQRWIDYDPGNLKQKNYQKTMNVCVFTVVISIRHIYFYTKVNWQIFGFLIIIFCATL